MSLEQKYTGRAEVFKCLAEKHRLHLAIECYVGEFPNAVQALFDTGSQWSVLNRDIAHHMGLTGEPEDEAMNTRLGTMRGTRTCIPVRFPVDSGEPLEVDATWFVSSEWPGPTVIGWEGCLDSVRFALDPVSASIFFAACDGSETSHL